MQRVLKSALWLCAGALLYYAFCVQIIDSARLTTFTWLTAHWKNISNYSHGPLIPFIATGVLWWSVAGHGRSVRKDWTILWMSYAAALVVSLLPDMLQHHWPGTPGWLFRFVQFLPMGVLGWQVWLLRQEMPVSGSEALKLGAGVLSLAMAVFYVGVKGEQERVVVLSVVVVLYGLALILAGRAGFRVFFFPISFLLLMIPLNFVDEIVGFPLRMMVAKAATLFLNLLGIATMRVGTAIKSSELPPRFAFDVADPCSGIRSLMALTTVTAAYAYVTQTVQWKRWVLFLSAMPLAMLGNFARVTSIGVVAQVYGQELAATAYHDYSGYVVFGVALTTMVFLGWLLNVPYRQLWDRLMKPPLPPPGPALEKSHG